MTERAMTGLALDAGGTLPQRVLCFAAHPDDIDFGAAGTIAAWTARGVEVSYCIMTDGDAGGFDPAGRQDMSDRRSAEQRAAAAAVGVRDIHFLGQRDGYLALTDDVLRATVALIRKVRPDIVLAMHPERDWERIHKSHPDHLACGEIVTRAVYPAVENPFAFPELQEQGLEAYRLPWLWLYAGPKERHNRFVDVTDHVEDKLAALRAHMSQHPDVALMEQRVRATMRHIARAAGMPEGRSAEVFHAVAINAPETFAGF